jgi:hypothetical protein
MTPTSPHQERTPAASHVGSVVSSAPQRAPAEHSPSPVVRG